MIAYPRFPYVAAVMAAIVAGTVAPVANAQGSTGCGADNVSRELPGPAPNANDYQQALAANNARDYSTALRIINKILADAAASGANLPANFPWRNVVGGKYAHHVAWAQNQLGLYYEIGLGVPQDYRAAAGWYQAAINTQWCGDPTSISIGATINLGRLNFYGQGVARNPTRARQLWAETGSAGAHLVSLYDHSALPQSIDAWGSFNFQSAIAKVDAQERSARAAQEERERAQQRQQEQLDEAAARRAATAASQYYPPHATGPGSSSGNKDNCSLGDYMFAPGALGNFTAGMYLGSGCH